MQSSGMSADYNGDVLFTVFSQLYVDIEVSCDMICMMKGCFYRPLF